MWTSTTIINSQSKSLGNAYFTISSAKGDDAVIARQTVHIYMYQDLVSWSGNWIYVNYAFSNTQSKNISNVYWSTRATKPDGTLIDGNIYSMDITPSTPSPAVSKTFCSIYRKCNGSKFTQLGS